MVSTTAITAVLTEAFKPVAGAIDKLTSILKESATFADKTQKASLALGLDLTAARDKLGPSLDGLRGTIQQKFTIGLLGLESGLKGNTKGVNKLVNQQMLTGTEFTKTHKVFARLQQIGGLNTRALDSLSTDTRELGGIYGVKTDVLVGALASLENHLVTLDMFGMAEGMTDAVQEFGAQLGPVFIEKHLPRFLDKILQTGTEGLTELTTLGVGDIRERLFEAGNDTQQILGILQNSAKTMSSSFRDLGGADGFLAAGAAGKQIKDLGQLATAITNKLGRGLDQNEQAMLNFHDTIENLRAEALDPLKKIMVDVFPTMLGIIKSVSEATNKWLSELMPGKDSLQTFNIILVKGSLKLLNFVDGMVTITKKFGVLTQAIDKYTKWLPGRMLTDAVVDWATDEFTNKDTVQNTLLDNIGKSLRAQLRELESGNKERKNLLNRAASIDDKIPPPKEEGPEFLDDSMRIIGEALEGVFAPRTVTMSAFEREVLEMVERVVTGVETTADKDLVPPIHPIG